MHMLLNGSQDRLTSSGGDLQWNQKNTETLCSAINSFAKLSSWNIFLCEVPWILPWHTIWNWDLALVFDLLVSSGTAHGQLDQGSFWEGCQDYWSILVLHHRSAFLVPCKMGIQHHLYYDQLSGLWSSSLHSPCSSNEYISAWTPSKQRKSKFLHLLPILCIIPYLVYDKMQPAITEWNFCLVC